MVDFNQIKNGTETKFIKYELFIVNLIFPGNGKYKKK